jgi:AraC-like DNA-binding protein
LGTGSIRDLQFVTAGYLPQKREGIRGRFALHAVGLVVSGEGTFRVGSGRTAAVLPGSVFFVRPGAVFAYGPNPGSSWQEYYFGVTGAGVARWRRLGWLPPNPYPCPVAGLADAVDGFRNILRLLAHAGRGDADRAVLASERLLLELSLGRDTAAGMLVKGSPLNRVMAACRTGFTERIDFVALARANGLSYSSLRQQFRRQFGLAPAHYVTRLRCERARTLLAETERPIKQVAAEVGIPDPFTFSRTFKRTVGLSPVHYRRQAAPWMSARGGDKR